jgi:TRAP-type C4-dicarboxylate transport system permease small subunit
MIKFIRTFLQACADLAGVALIALMTMTVADIVGRHFHVFALRGIIELSTGVTVLIGFLAFPFSFLQGGHIVLDTFTGSLPARVTKCIDVFWYIIATIIFVVLAVLTWRALIDVYEANETSMDLQIPMVWLWIPAAIGISLSPIACILAGYARAYGNQKLH